MEGKNEKSLNGEATNSKTKLPKPPTRLQKRAPAGLQLDQIPNAGNTHYPFPSPGDEINNASVGCAIPLLSPLVLSPVPSQGGEEAELGEEKKKRFVGSKELGGRGISHSSNNDNNTIAPPQPLGNPGGGWRHPAADAFPDPSSLFSFFQSQCVLVNRVQ